MRCKIIIFCATLLLLLTGSHMVFAEEFDPNKTGSISVTLIEQKENTPIVGAELSVYHVATALLDENENLIYNYTNDFKQLGTAINDVSLVTKLDSFVSQNSVPSTKMTTNTEGTAWCNKLPIGLYFVKQTVAVEGFVPCNSFLVTVPNEKEGEYVYEVNATPKTEVARYTSITIKKVWNTDRFTELAESVTVQLLRDGNVIKTAILNAQNNWQVTYTDIPKSDAYSIKEVDVPKGFTATYKQKGSVFTVTNTSTLIQTGQLIWPIPVFVMCGILFFAVGIKFLYKKRKQMTKGIGVISVCLGVLCMLSAVGFVVYNKWEAENAEEISQDIVEDVQSIIKEEKSGQPVANDSQMPTVEADGYDCIGILYLPVLDLKLPVLTDWSYEKLKKAPCHYYGSYYEKNFVIAAHNYKTHFGRLSELQKGDLVVFTDVNGIAHYYEVVILETLPQSATKEMITSGFDLSLYTCTPGGNNRVTVRCNAVDGAN